jgi:hypothetical protein
VKVTVAVCAIVTLSLVSVAVYVTASAFVSVTVKVATPSAPVVPATVVIVECPVLWLRVTVLPLTGLLFASRSVTVIVDVAVPSATTDVGFATTVDVAADAVPASTVKLLEEPEWLLLSVAVMTSLPAFVTVTLTVQTPFVQLLQVVGEIVFDASVSVTEPLNPVITLLYWSSAVIVSVKAVPAVGDVLGVPTP